MPVINQHKLLLLFINKHLFVYIFIVGSRCAYLWLRLLSQMHGLRTDHVVVSSSWLLLIDFVITLLHGWGRAWLWMESLRVVVVDVLLGTVIIWIIALTWVWIWWITSWIELLHSLVQIFLVHVLELAVNIHKFRVVIAYFSILNPTSCHHNLTQARLVESGWI